jgi:hypothetical protein
LRVESGGTVRVFGDLQVDGTTTTVNSTVVTIDDPVLTLGGDTAPSSDDNKDRGIEFRYYDGSAKIGFMGWDDSTHQFRFFKDATNSSEVFSGTDGDLRVGALSAYGNISITGDKSILNQGDAAKGSIRFYDQSGGIIMLNGGTTNPLRFDSHVKFLDDKSIIDGDDNTIFNFYTSAYDGVSAPILRFASTMVLEGANAPSFLSRDNIVLRIDSNNDSTSNFFKVEHNAGTELFKVEEDGKVTATGTIRSAAGTIDLSHATTGSQTSTITSVDGNKLKLDSSFTLTGEAGVSINLDAPTVNISGSASGGNGLAIVASATPVANNTTLHIGDGFGDSIGFTGRARNATQFFVNRDISSGAEDLIRFQENGTSRFVIDESGNVGIGGITAPATKVHILNGTSNDPHIRLSDPNSSSTNDATGYLEVYHGNTTGRAAYFGMITSAELAMATTTSNGKFRVYTGNNQAALTIDNSQRVGIGTTTPAFDLDIHGNVRITDNKILRFGEGDLQLHHNTVDSKINNFTGDLTIANFADAKDIIFQSDDGSGGVATYLTIDGSATKIQADKPVCLSDGVYLNLGSGNDFDARHNGTDFQARCSTGDMNFIQADSDQDMVFQCDNGSGSPTPYITLDGSEEEVVVSKKMRATAIIQSPSSSITPANNGELVVEATTNSKITFKLKGTDGTVRSAIITLS